MSWDTPPFAVSWRYAGWTSSQESAAAGSVDSAGNLLLCGKARGRAFSADDDTYGSTSTADFAAAKVRGDTGSLLWAWVDSSSSSKADVMVSLDTDSEDAIVLGGFTYGTWDSPNQDGNRDIAAVKLRGSSGSEIWRYQADASTSSAGGLGSSYVQAVAIDGEDDAFLLGSTLNSLIEQENYPDVWSYFAIKLDGSTGSELWRIQGEASSTREGLQGAKVDSAGDVVAAGYIWNEDSATSSFYVVKLSGLDGSLVWEYAPSSTSGDAFHSVDIDGQDNVYLAGSAEATTLQGNDSASPVVVKLEGSGGAEMWLYEGVATSGTIFYGVAVDPVSGLVVAAGSTEGTWAEGAEQGGFDFAGVILDSESGVELARFQNGTDGTDVVQFAGFDADGSLFFGGFSNAAWSGDAGDEDVIGIKFEPFGPVAVPSPASTTAPTSGPTPSPLFRRTSVPAAATLAPGLPTPSPTSAAPALAAATITPTSAEPSQPPEEARDTPVPSPSPSQIVASATSEEANFERWEVGAIAAGSALAALFLALCLWCARRNATRKQKETAQVAQKAQRIMPIPMTKEHHEAFANLYPSSTSSPTYSFHETFHRPTDGED